MTKPFLLLQSRPETEAADNEYEAFMKFGGLLPEMLARLRVEDGSMPLIHLDEYAGIIVGGGPYNMSAPSEKKSSAQLDLERGFHALLARVIEADFPFLGACYGVGLLTAQGGGMMSRKYGEPVGPVPISLTPDGVVDPLLVGMPSSFDAFVGHKEACEVLPPQAVLLASSPTCPVQMFRIKRNVYATQFHPELDSHGLELRINIYKHAGYFDPDEAEVLIARGHEARVIEPLRIVRNFVEMFRADLSSP